MKNLAKIAVAICFILIILVFFHYTQEDPATTSSIDISSMLTENSTVDEENLSEELIDDAEAISVAVRGIVLTQGEKGEEAWRLNATAASMDQENGQVSINQPHITYYLKRENRILTIKSHKGFLNQADSIIELKDEVRVEEAENILTTNEAIYDGNGHMLDLPKPLEFFNPMFTGSANTANWDLNNDIINAAGNINVTIISKNKKKK